MSEQRETGKVARAARRAANRRRYRSHGDPVPDPEHTTVMHIPDHIRALTEKGADDEQTPERS